MHSLCIAHPWLRILLHYNPFRKDPNEELRVSNAARVATRYAHFNAQPISFPRIMKFRSGQLRLL